jgi:hypothetical protein
MVAGRGMSARVFSCNGASVLGGGLGLVTLAAIYPSPARRTHLHSPGDQWERVSRAVGLDASNHAAAATTHYYTCSAHNSTSAAQMQELQDGLDAAVRALKPKGRLATITFHSKEHSIVERFAKAAMQNGTWPGYQNLCWPPSGTVCRHITALSMGLVPVRYCRLYPCRRHAPQIGRSSLLLSFYC